MNFDIINLLAILLCATHVKTRKNFSDTNVLSVASPNIYENA